MIGPEGMAIHSILVVDDDPATCKMIGRLLEPAGYSVASAGGAREAMQALDQQEFDLVLTDLIMPEGDGFELISAMQRDQSGTRVIAMSGGGRVGADTYLTMARGFHVDGLLRKPFTRDQLLNALKDVDQRPALSE
jgi:CheY-like chemotaxis protein